MKGDQVAPTEPNHAQAGVELSNDQAQEMLMTLASSRQSSSEAKGLVIPSDQSRSGNRLKHSSNMTEGKVIQITVQVNHTAHNRL